MTVHGMRRRDFLRSGIATAFAINPLHNVAALPALNCDAEVGGQYYAWQRTMKPERPWLRNYSQTVVMKIFLCSRDGGGNVDKINFTFSEALEVIKRLDNATLGIPKIVYLVGWQFNGHDSGYPSWSVVNEHLKRPQDSTAVQSLRWLMREAKKHHTTLSLHINMFDAYKDSPLWQTYDENNIIIKDEDGTPIKGELMGGMQSYQISYAQEWKTGLAQKRIDNLLAMLPELEEAATIHVDAFHSVQPVRSKATLSTPYLGLTVDDEIRTQRKIFRYWRTRGIDMTTEGDIYPSSVDSSYKDPFVGLQPMTWFFEPQKFRELPWIGKPAKFSEFPPTLYCGTPMHGEAEIAQDPEHLLAVIRQFCTQAAPWYYRNNMQPKPDGFEAEPVDGNVFLPLQWLPSTLLAFSEKGYVTKRWQVPETYAENVRVQRITANGLEPVERLPVNSHAIVLTVKAGDALVISA